MSDSTGTPTFDLGDDFAEVAVTILLVDDLRSRLRLIAEADRGAQDLREALRIIRRDTLQEIRRTDPLATWAELGELCGGVTAQRAVQMSVD